MPKLLVSQVAALLVEELGADAGTLCGGGFEARPFGTTFTPLGVEETLPAIGGGHEPDGGIRVGGDHGADSFVEIVRHARSFVDQQQGDIGEAANGGFAARQSDDASAIGQGERDGVVAITAREDAELAQEAAGFADELGRLASRWRGDDGERLGVVERLMDGADGDGGGLAPLAATVEEAAANSGVEGTGLVRVRLEGEVVYLCFTGL